MGFWLLGVSERERAERESRFGNGTIAKDEEVWMGFVGFRFLGREGGV